MVSVLFLLVVALSLDWAKNCKAVNYNYKVYGKSVTEYYGGCKKGCFGYHNDTGTGDTVDDYGQRKQTSPDDHFEQVECVECKTITVDWYKTLNPGFSGTDEEATKNTKNRCDSRNCYWRKGKCVAGSCLVAAAAEKCDTDFGHEFVDGKCKRVKGNNCKAQGYAGSNIYTRIGSTASSTNPYLSPDDRDKVMCGDLAKYDGDYSMGPGVYVTSDPYTEDDAAKCKYECEHPEVTYYAGGPWDYTRAGRKYCHKVVGCMYSKGDPGESCSALAIWAFVLILVIAILVFLAIIVVIVILLLKLCGGKSTKVDPAPAADKSASAPSAAKSTPGAAAAAPATQAPPPEVGPYVVIKLGKQESKTKKVESAAWGQSIVFTGVGAEDDDVVFELHDNSDALLGSADVRIPDYVNAKKRVPINLKNGEAVIGVLEADIEIQVQEEPEVKITGVFFVDKFTKA